MHFARGLQNGSVNVIPHGLLRPSRRVAQMHKEGFSCFRRSHCRDVQIHGLFSTCDCYPSGAAHLRLQLVDLDNFHALQRAEASLKMFPQQLNDRTDTVLLCNDHPVIG